MRRIFLTTIVAVLVFVASAPGASSQTAFVGATLFDGTGADPVENAVVIVMGDRVLEVGPRDEIEIPDYLPVVDLSGKWIVPGLDRRPHPLFSVGRALHPARRHRSACAASLRNGDGQHQG